MRSYTATHASNQAHVERDDATLAFQVVGDGWVEMWTFYEFVLHLDLWLDLLERGYGAGAHEDVGEAVVAPRLPAAP